MFIKKSILISLVLILSLSVLVALNLDQIGNGLLLGAKYTYSKNQYLNFLGIITFFFCVFVTIQLNRSKEKFIFTPTILFMFFMTIISGCSL